MITNTPTAEAYRESLKAVIDPEIYQNIVDLGLVYNVDVSPENGVDVTMTYTTPMCPLGPQIKENVEKVLTEAGAASVTIKIVFQPQWTPYMMTEELQRTLGILPEEAEMAVEEEEEPWRPPPEPKKKGLLSRMFGW